MRALMSRICWWVACCFIVWCVDVATSTSTLYAVTTQYGEATCETPALLTFVVAATTTTTTSSSGAMATCQAVTECTRASTVACTISTPLEYAKTVFQDTPFVVVEKYVENKCKGTLTTLLALPLSDACVRLDTDTYVRASRDLSTASGAVNFGTYSDSACIGGQTINGITSDVCLSNYYFHIHDPEQFTGTPAGYKATAYYADTQCGPPPAIVWFKGYANDTNCTTSSCASGTQVYCTSSVPSKFAQSTVAFGSTHTFVLVEYFMDPTCTGNALLTMALLPIAKCVKCDKCIDHEYVMLSLTNNVVTLAKQDIDNSSCLMGTSIKGSPSDGCKNQYRFTIFNAATTSFATTWWRLVVTVLATAWMMTTSGGR